MEEIRLVNRAKWALISHYNMSEPDAHRYIEKLAEQLDVLHTRLVLAIFQVGNFPLGHFYRTTQFGLIQFFFFPKEPKFFSKCQFHTITAYNLS